MELAHPKTALDYAPKLGFSKYNIVEVSYYLFAGYKNANSRHRDGFPPPACQLLLDGFNLKISDAPVSQCSAAFLQNFVDFHLNRSIFNECRAR